MWLSRSGRGRVAPEASDGLMAPMTVAAVNAAVAVDRASSHGVERVPIWPVSAHFPRILNSILLSVMLGP